MPHKMLENPTQEQLTQREWQRRFRKTEAGRRHVRKMNLKAKGMTPEQYDEALEAQGGVCAACGEIETGVNQHGSISLAVDHDHNCCPDGKACNSCRRGLLCMRCNRALGLLSDSTDTINALLEYRRKYS